MTTLLPEAALRQAWARALRFPLSPQSPYDIVHHAVRLDDGTALAVRIDQDGAARWARVVVHRDDPAMTHAEAVPLATSAFLLGRFEPFTVESVRGTDGLTWHYVIDLVRYKEARADRLLAGGRTLLGPTASDAEVHFAARQMALPFAALAASADLIKARAGDPRTIDFLSDRFQVPAPWVEALVEDFFVARREGRIDAAGNALDA